MSNELIKRILAEHEVDYDTINGKLLSDGEDLTGCTEDRLKCFLGY